MAVLLPRFTFYKSAVSLFPRTRITSRLNFCRDSTIFARNMASAIANTSIPQDSSDLSNIFTEDVSRSLLDFWFGDSSLYPTQEEGAARWFQPNTEFDEQCRYEVILALIQSFQLANSDYT